MKLQHVYDVDAPKKPVSLSANSALVSRAKKAGLNLSQTFEDALVDKLRKTLEEQWLEENRQAILDYNSRIEQHGVFGASKRRF